ncbi:MAG: division/cell wall cluster transcriptional repressor MraZ [Armatimonadetes bacterium]|nr:division/cell wall cluster transcriptional repressor MraZ [Armatimonadota bacterium]
MFSGAYEHSIDSKGRTVIPAKFRTKLGERFILTRGLNGCLWGFSQAVWPDVQEKLVPKSFLDQRGITLERYFLGSAVECAPDRQGRVAIPSHLLEHAGIESESDIWIIGLSDKIEVWSKSRWEEFNDSLTDEVLSRLANDLEVTTSSATTAD